MDFPALLEALKTLSEHLRDDPPLSVPPNEQIRLPLHALLTIWQHGYQTGLGQTEHICRKCGLRQNATSQTDDVPF